MLQRGLAELRDSAYIMGMAEPLKTVRKKKTHIQELGLPMPRSFSRTAYWRFARDRRRRLLELLPGPPTNQQAAHITSLCKLEWHALASEAQGGLVGFREAREHRRLYERLLSDFERSAAKASAAAEKHPQSISAYYADIVAQSRAAE
jgi:hypothetical protein